MHCSDVAACSLTLHHAAASHMSHAALPTTSCRPAAAISNGDPQNGSQKAQVCCHSMEDGHVTCVVRRWDNAAHSISRHLHVVSHTVYYQARGSICRDIL